MLVNGYTAIKSLGAETFSSRQNCRLSRVTESKETMNFHRSRVVRRSRAAASERPTEIVAGVVLHDPTGRIVAASEQAAHLLGLAGPALLVGRGSLVDDSIAIRLDGSSFPAAEQPAAIALRSGRAHPDTVLGLRLPNGETSWFYLRAEPLMKVGACVPYMAASRFMPIRILPEKLTSLSRMHAISITRAGWQSPARLRRAY
jgi:PAS domain-containing protein